MTPDKAGVDAPPRMTSVGDLADPHPVRPVPISSGMHVQGKVKSLPILPTPRPNILLPPLSHRITLLDTLH
jgi:hypothetical protein